MDTLTTSDYIRAIGVIVTFLSLIYGFIQNKQKREIKRLAANDAIVNHQIAGVALGAIQHVKNNTVNPLIEVGVTEGYLQSLVSGTAKLYCNIKNTTIEDIDEMITNDQLVGNFKQAFYQCSTNAKRGFLRNFIKRLEKLW